MYLPGHIYKMKSFVFHFFLPSEQLEYGWGAGESVWARRMKITPQQLVKSEREGTWVPGWPYGTTPARNHLPTSGLWLRGKGAAILNHCVLGSNQRLAWFQMIHQGRHISNELSSHSLNIQNKSFHLPLCTTSSRLAYACFFRNFSITSAKAVPPLVSTSPLQQLRVLLSKFTFPLASLPPLAGERWEAWCKKYFRSEYPTLELHIAIGRVEKEGFQIFRLLEGHSPSSWVSSDIHSLAIIIFLAISGSVLLVSYMWLYQ